MLVYAFFETFAMVRAFLEEHCSKAAEVRSLNSANAGKQKAGCINYDLKHDDPPRIRDLDLGGRVLCEFLDLFGCEFDFHGGCGFVRKS